MQLLLFHGADINWTDADGNTALHMVCYGEPGAASRLDCLQLLLSRKVSRRKWNKKGLLPIHCSAMQGRIDVIQALMDFDAHPTSNTVEIADKRDTPSLLYLSVANSHLKCANWLISKAFTFKPGEQEELMFNVLLDETKVEDQVQILNFLFKNGVHVNALNEKGKSVLHLTALDLDLYDILAALLDCGADVNIEDDECRTPLFYSVFASNLHSARLLIEHGANVRHQDSHSLTAFGYIPGYDEWLESGLFSEGITQLLQSYDLHRCTSFVRDMTRKIKEKEMSERFSSIKSRLDWLTFRKSTYGEMTQHRTEH
ncbi:transient receptor potential cation channel subfamily A member 1-like [Lissotriton helveticus]